MLIRNRLFTIIFALLTASSCGGKPSADNQQPVQPAPSGQVTFSRSVGVTTYAWTFDCGTSPCLYGTFINGDYWVAPSGGGSVMLSSIATSATSAGLEINPTNPNKQGFLSCHPTTYDASLNKANSLPLSVVPGSSIVKATSRTSGCQPSGADCCIDTYDAVTVLASPPTAGLNAFRPPLAGTNKPIFDLGDFDFSRLPADPRVNNTGLAADFAGTVGRWSAPFVDHYMWKFGDQGRRFSPKSIPDYGADMGMTYLNDLIRVMGTEPLAAKQAAVNALIQRGLDLYYSYKAGIQWPAGAGQQVGRKPAVAFFGAMVTDAAISAEIQALTANNGNLFHEDGQIKVNTSTGNVPVWGDECAEGFYWANVFYEQKFAGGTGTPIGSGDNFRVCGDPYGWIDGPGGLPGTEYMECCSTGPFISYQVAQSLMPEYCSVANDTHLSIYTRRVLSNGIHTQPDACAPPDPREPPACAPYAAGSPNCQYYKVTWGPDPAKPGDCIRNGPSQSGRFPARHGVFMTNIFNESPISKKLREQQGNIILGSCN